MGNEISHKRYCSGKPEMLERTAAVQENAATDLPVAQTALGAVLGSNVNHPPEEKRQDTATGMGNKDVGRESEMASSSLPVAQTMQRTTDLQGLDETHPSPDQSEQDEDKAATIKGPYRQTCASTRERPAMAQQAEGDEEVAKTDLPLPAMMETGATGAEDAVTDLTTVESNLVLRKRPRGKLCKPSPLCRWLKQLRTPAGKAKVKPGALLAKSEASCGLQKDNRVPGTSPSKKD